MLVANARMYSATPGVGADWKVLLQWVLRHADLPWAVIDHASPAPLDALWAREDLGLAMMCGLPFSQRQRPDATDVPRPSLVAAPIPSPARYEGRPVYFTDLVVRADAPWRTLEETFGGTLGYTVPHSMSGAVALRLHLAKFRSAPDRPLYRRSVGGYLHARAVVEGLVRGEIDVGPLDSYYHDLLVRNDPSLAARVRTVAVTEARPIPPLIATAALDERTLDTVRGALHAAMADSSLAEVRDRLLLAGFAVPSPGDYAGLAELAERPAPPMDRL